MIGMIIVAKYDLIENPEKKGVFSPERGAKLLPHLWQWQL
jgi:hypothetical protein